ncbi:hypothetical protein HYPBUDRAFT_224956 [Hyphopichia burtonii NRRL Y-1933]|uniref:Uncharacterized protein n=1 Tax=Hyphopichia burtonii NRRL Y-1933 TaxID=984485 RepID=A0A1E4RDR4_9ASCO|nr:hypothetical protein HYPBUDRAFT_224956 [Hyphopichia burtonii NRRL Y-1933]ODV65392.1 hypothetical protein HYPBUDRAFT_224956 [Hyphopichia burtonii NRRL Y-1933]
MFFLFLVELCLFHLISFSPSIFFFFFIVPTAVKSTIFCSRFDGADFLNLSFSVPFKQKRRDCFCFLITCWSVFVVVFSDLVSDSTMFRLELFDLMTNSNS